MNPDAVVTAQLHRYGMDRTRDHTGVTVINVSRKTLLNSSFEPVAASKIPTSGFLSFDRSRKPQSSTSPTRASASSASSSRRPASASASVLSVGSRPLSAVNRPQISGGGKGSQGATVRVQSAKLLRHDAAAAGHVRRSNGAADIDFRGVGVSCGS